ncbi:MAG TPA: hypothetical protein VMT47_13505 [Polyangia bacterium]|nr:hypothetical protein [Polyangia bacterium]
MTRPPRAKTRLPLAVLIVAAVLLAGARPAWALCPNCLGQHATLTPTMRIVGVFLLVPPAVFFFVARLVRRLGR